MTREGQGGDPEEVQRPASTRWSEPDAANDDALLPPFIPGRSRGQHGPRSESVDSPELAPESTRDPSPEWEVSDSEPALTPDADDEAFPFDGPVSWDIPGTAEPDAGENTSAGAAETGLPGEGAAEGPAEAESTEEWTGGTWVPEAPPVVGAADEVADRMQHLAARIRRDGASAARSEMASDDRLTALLAALIAGYIEGREG
jgi:hypothetical protein